MSQRDKSHSSVKGNGCRAWWGRKCRDGGLKGCGLWVVGDSAALDVTIQCYRQHRR